jgi:hypothetical protein
VPVKCSVEGSVAGLRATLEDFDAQMAPAPGRVIEGWLAELSVLVVSRASDEMSGELRLVAYAKRLAGYPADIVRQVLLGITWRFWPSWAELKEELDRALLPRRVMRLAIEGRLASAAAGAAPKIEQEPDRVSPEVAARILEQAGWDGSMAALLRRFPMARSREEAQKLEARAAAQVRHWSETADPDGPEWRALRAARDANPLVQAARAAQSAEDEP